MGMKVMEQVLKHSFLCSVAITQPFTISSSLAPTETFTSLNNNYLASGSTTSFFEERNPKVSKLSYYENRLDGSFQLLTEHTMKELQSSNHVPISGKVSSNTVNAINWEDKTSDLKTIEPLIDDLSFGEKSMDVKLVQEVLLHYDYYHGAVDSIFGPLTEQAIEEYRESVTTSEADQVATKTSSEPVKTDEINETTETKKLEVVQNNASITNHAKSFLGTPYVWGGTSPEGFDCSGYIQYLYEEQNITIPRTVREIWNFSTPIETPSIGDLVFFETYQAGPSHMGIYLGNDEFIHAGTSNGVVINDYKNDEYWSTRYLGAKRIE